MKTAIVHDYFTQLGGAERVAEELYGMAPESDFFTTMAVPQCVPGRLKEAAIRTSWMQNLPRITEYYRFYFLLYPWGVRSLNLSEYDLVISSSSSYAKGVHTHRDAIHVCYCHTPTRWVWNFDHYSRRDSFGPAQRLVLGQLVQVLKRWDESASRQPDHFVANSKVVAERIQKAYGRSSEVIHPPIDVSRFSISHEVDDYYLVLSRLVSYKRLDVAIEACTKLRRKLLIIGSGPDRPRLEALAGPTVTFLGHIPDRKVEHIASRCRALLFPGEEDFGMAPLEIAAAGRPTIAYRAGGAVESIIENETGVFFEAQTPEALAEVIEEFERMTWFSGLLRRHAETFSSAVFHDRFRMFLRRIGAPLPSDWAKTQSARVPQEKLGSVAS